MTSFYKKVWSFCGSPKGICEFLSFFVSNKIHNKQILNLILVNSSIFDFLSWFHIRFWLSSGHVNIEFIFWSSFIRSILSPLYIPLFSLYSYVYTAPIFIFSHLLTIGARNWIFNMASWYVNIQRVYVGVHFAANLAVVVTSVYSSVVNVHDMFCK